MKIHAMIASISTEPRFDPGDAFVPEDRDQHHECLAQHGEQCGAGESGEAGDEVVDRHPGEHRLHPAPAHEDDDVRGHGQQAAVNAERASGECHRGQAGAGADVADEGEHDRTADRAEHDHGERRAEVDGGAIACR
jgi:hypothetical protein